MYFSDIQIMRAENGVKEGCRRRGKQHSKKTSKQQNLPGVLTSLDGENLELKLECPNSVRSN